MFDNTFGDIKNLNVEIRERIKENDEYFKFEPQKKIGINSKNNCKINICYFLSFFNSFDILYQFFLLCFFYKMNTSIDMYFNNKNVYIFSENLNFFNIPFAYFGICSLYFIIIDFYFFENIFIGKCFAVLIIYFTKISVSQDHYYFLIGMMIYIITIFLYARKKFKENLKKNETSNKIIIKETNQNNYSIIENYFENNKSGILLINLKDDCNHFCNSKFSYYINNLYKKTIFNFDEVQKNSNIDDCKLINNNKNFYTNNINSIKEKIKENFTKNNHCITNQNETNTYIKNENHYYSDLNNIKVFDDEKKNPNDLNHKNIIRNYSLNKKKFKIKKNIYQKLNNQSRKNLNLYNKDKNKISKKNFIIQNKHLLLILSEINEINNNLDENIKRLINSLQIKITEIDENLRKYKINNEKISFIKYQKDDHIHLKDIPKQNINEENKNDLIAIDLLYEEIYNNLIILINEIKINISKADSISLGNINYFDSIINKQTTLYVYFNNFNINLNSEYKQSLILNIEDITELVNFQEDKISRKFKNMFLKKFSHEFKNPLLNIRQICDNFNQTIKNRHINNISTISKYNNSDNASNLTNPFNSNMKNTDTNYFIIDNSNNRNRNIFSDNNNMADDKQKRKFSYLNEKKDNLNKSKIENKNLLNINSLNLNDLHKLKTYSSIKTSLKDNSNFILEINDLKREYENVKSIKYICEYMLLSINDFESIIDPINHIKTIQPFKFEENQTKMNYDKKILKNKKMKKFEEENTIKKEDFQIKKEKLIDLCKDSNLNNNNSIGILSEKNNDEKKYQKDSENFIDLDKLLKYFLKIFETKINILGKYILLFYDIDKAIPKKISINEKKLKQIIFNLLSNSVKFTLSGKITIKIEYQKETQEIIFKITDTGIGINTEIIKKIGEPYFKTSNNNNDYGIGMGIYIVKNHVKSLNGEIEISSKIMKGTTVILKFPYNIEKNKLIFEDTEKLVMRRLKSEQSNNKSFLTNKIDETININSNFDPKYNNKQVNLFNYKYKNINKNNKSISNSKKSDIPPKIDAQHVYNIDSSFSKSFEISSSNLNIFSKLDNNINLFKNLELSNSPKWIFKDENLSSNKIIFNKNKIFKENKYIDHNNDINLFKKKSNKINIDNDHIYFIENKNNFYDLRQIDTYNSNNTLNQNLNNNVNSNISLEMDFHSIDKISPLKHELYDEITEKGSNVAKCSDGLRNFNGNITNNKDKMNFFIKRKFTNYSDQSFYPIQNISLNDNSEVNYNFYTNSKGIGVKSIHKSNSLNINDSSSLLLKNNNHNNTDPNIFNSPNFHHSNNHNIKIDSNGKIIEDLNDSNPLTLNNISQITLKIEDSKINTNLNSIKICTENSFLSKIFHPIVNKKFNEKDNNHSHIENDDSLTVLSESHRSENNFTGSFSFNKIINNNKFLQNNNNYIDSKFSIIKNKTDESSNINKKINIDSSLVKNANQEIYDDKEFQKEFNEFKYLKKRIEEKNSKSEDNIIYELFINNNKDRSYSNRETKFNKKKSRRNSINIKITNDKNSLNNNNCNKNYYFIKEQSSQITNNNQRPISELNSIEKNKRCDKINIIKEEPTEESEIIQDSQKFKYSKYLSHRQYSNFSLQNISNSDENSFLISSKNNKNKNKNSQRKIFSSIDDDENKQTSRKVISEINEKNKNTNLHFNSSKKNLKEFEREVIIDDKEEDVLKILIVEDEILIRQSQINIIRKFLKRKNILFEITECQDGIECIYKIYEGINNCIKYDLIITDETMNFMKGSFMAKTLKKLIEENVLYDIKIYMVTSYDAENYKA